MKIKILHSIYSLCLFAITLNACNGVKTFEYHTKEQLAYIKDQDYTNIDKYIKTNTTGEPLPLSITLPSKATDLIVSENSDYSSSIWNFNVDNLSSYNLYNSKSDTTYFYKAVDDKGKVLSSGSYKTTSFYPRNIFVDNVDNVRDLGFKGFIKQGLIYRGGEFDYYRTSTRVTISKEGIDTLVNQLAIKTELDLRFTNEAKIVVSSLGKDVNYYFTPLFYQGKQNILTYQEGEANNPSSIQQIISILANKDNYPLYFHCAAGKDRTGLISYLIKGLLGQNESDIYKDYLFSNFANENVTLDTFFAEWNYVETINKYQGDTLSEKIHNYLVEVIGSSEEELSSIISILGE